MAGTSIELTVMDAEVIAMLQGVASRLGSMRPAFAEIGEIVTESVQRNFEEHRSPEGGSWKPLNPVYAKAKAAGGRNASDILILSTDLMKSIHPEAYKDKVTVGTGPHIVYAAVHQFGASFSVIKNKSTVNIPARPYMGVRDEDWSEMRNVLSLYIDKELS